MQLTKSFVTNELQKLVSFKADNWGSLHMESFTGGGRAIDSRKDPR